MKEALRLKIIEIIHKMGIAEIAYFDITTPPKPEMGEYSTNVAMILAARGKDNPMELAQKISTELNLDSNYKASPAKPGFVNVEINRVLYFNEIIKVLSENKDYGRAAIGTGQSVSIDYVSANPTGPVHIGNARGGPIGEVIANLCEWFGFKVFRDFYLNDTGVQTKRLGESLYYYYEADLGENPIFPEDGYKGEYIKEVYNEVKNKYKKDLKELINKDEIIEFLRVKGLEKLILRIKTEVELLDIKYDNWYSQTAIQESGKTKEIILRLEKKGMTTKREGALWFVNPDDPNFEDKESVLEKSDERTLTYFADDLAFHALRLDKGVKKIIDLWGANHHGHVSRMESGLKALGYSPDRTEIILYQFVRVKEGGELTKMSKREGNFVTLADVLKSGVSPDAFKYFIISQNPNTPIDFDIKLATEKSEKNPIYYIQYAHARIASIVKKCGAKERERAGDIKAKGLTSLNKPEELILLEELARFPEICEEAYDGLKIQLLPHYAYKIATLFHDFYTKHRVIDENEKVNSPRLALCIATKIILANTLALCDIKAPEKM